MSLIKVKEFLSDRICESMYMEKEELEGDMLFSDFGLESTTLINIIAKVNEEFSCNVEMKDLLAHQSLDDSAEFIHQQLSN